MKLKLDPVSLINSYGPLIWCIRVVNTILSSKEALEAWLFPAILKIAHFYQQKLTYSDIHDIFAGVQTIPVVDYFEEDAGQLSMVAVPSNDPDNKNAIYRTIKIVVSVTYSGSLLYQPTEHANNAKLHALITLLHGTMHILTPHILSALHVDAKVTPAMQLSPREYIDFKKPASERAGGLGIAWEETLFNGILVAPDPVYSVLCLATLKDKNKYYDDVNIERSMIPSENCDRILRALDDWVNPSWERRVFCLPNPCPLQVFDTYGT